jgi:sigma-70-like protein
MAMATPPGTAFDAQAQYLREIAAIPSLTDQEERHLVAMLQSPDIELIKHARTRLVECFQPLVLSIAKRYAPRCQHLQLLDLVQEGNLALFRRWTHMMGVRRQLDYVPGYSSGFGARLRTRGSVTKERCSCPLRRLAP